MTDCFEARFFFLSDVSSRNPANLRIIHFNLMKTLQKTLLMLAGFAVSANAEIISFAEYNLGERGAVTPVDSSGNNRNFLSGAALEQLTVGTEGEIAATGSTAFLQLAGAGFFNGPFSDLATDNFAVGIYARAAGDLEGNNPVVEGTLVQHVFQTGDREQNSVRISLGFDGWEATYQPVPNVPETPVISIGTPRAFVADEWVHLAIIRINGETSFYVDGVAQGAPETTVDPAHGASAHLGINSGGAASFPGDIDALRAVTFTPEDEDAASIIAALQGIDSDADGLLDVFEQRIIDAIADDAITSLAEVLPGDDFDGDGLSNLEEQNGASDPTDVNDPPPPLSTDLELIAYWDFNDPSVFDEVALEGESLDLVAGYGAFMLEAFFTEDGGGFSGNPGDFGVDLTVEFDPNPDNPDFLLAPLVVVDGFSSSGEEFLEAINSTTGDDRMVVSFWQRLVGLQNSSAFWFQSTEDDRGMQGHVPWGNGALFFDHLVGGARNRLTGTPAASGDPPMPFDFLQWRHYLFVKDGATKEIWIDGALILSASNGTGFSTEMTAFYMGMGINGGNLINGLIDEFAIFNLKPSDAQIAALAAGTSPMEVANVVVVPPASDDFLITAIERDGDMVTLTWNSSEEETYAISFSLDLISFDGGAGDNITPAAGTETTMTIDLSTLGIENEESVFFRVEEELPAMVE